MKKKQIKLKWNQSWRPKRGKWRYIYAIGADSGEIHFFEGSRSRKHSYWTKPEDFIAWIEHNQAVLVK